VTRIELDISRTTAVTTARGRDTGEIGDTRVMAVRGGKLSALGARTFARSFRNRLVRVAVTRNKRTVTAEIDAVAEFVSVAEVVAHRLAPLGVIAP
jgi:hypothetical protein